MKFKVLNGEINLKEKNYILDEIKGKNPDKEIESITVTIDGEYLDINFTYKTLQFERIRRITGYLVGTLDRFNNAKRSEVEDRIKHTTFSVDDSVKSKSKKM